MESKFKNEIIIKFNSNDEILANDICNMFLNMLNDNNIKLKALRTSVNVGSMDLKSRGDELLSELGINVKDIYKNKDILEADNFSATLITKNN